MWGLGELFSFTFHWPRLHACTLTLLPTCTRLFLSPFLADTFFFPLPPPLPPLPSPSSQRKALLSASMEVPLSSNVVLTQGEGYNPLAWDNTPDILRKQFPHWQTCSLSVSHSTKKEAGIYNIPYLVHRDDTGHPALCPYIWDLYVSLLMHTVKPLIKDSILGKQ